MVWIVILVIVALLVIALITLYNRFVRLRNRVDNAWAQIEVQLQRRNDLIPNLVETVKGFAAQEERVLREVTEARAGSAAPALLPRRSRPRTSSRTRSASSRRRGALPRAQGNENFLRLQDELAGTENRLGVARKRYNDVVQRYNNAIQTFPGVVLAGPFNFEKREFFETDVTQREAPQVEFGADAAPTPAAPAAPPPRPQTRARAAHPVARRGSMRVTGTCGWGPAHITSRPARSSPIPSGIGEQ